MQVVCKNLLQISSIFGAPDFHGNFRCNQVASTKTRRHRAVMSRRDGSVKRVGASRHGPILSEHRPVRPNAIELICFAESRNSQRPRSAGVACLRRASFALVKWSMSWAGTCSRGSRQRTRMPCLSAARSKSGTISSSARFIPMTR